MFNSKMLFILGAGASREVEFPLGSELKVDIAKRLNVQIGRQRSEDDGILLSALRRHVQSQTAKLPNIVPYLEAGQRIARAMPQAISIDNYLDAHSNDECVLFVGKLAIVRAILVAEQNSKLSFEPASRSQINFSTISNTWYNKFFQLLTENVKRAQLASLFENITCISFNYDRSFEHFLVHALENYYAISQLEAAELVRSLMIVHPYGVVGDLPWQTNGHGVPFGGSDNANELLSVAGRIRIFTEQIEDVEVLSSLRTKIMQAETIVFLGFAFHDINMQLLQSDKPSLVQRVFATSKGISGSDGDIIDKQIGRTLNLRPSFFDLKRLGVECRELFDTYWRSLAS